MIRRIADDPRLGALAVLLIAMAVYLPRLGADGLAGTEGHRVIPGWELLERLEAGAGGGGSAGGPGGAHAPPGASFVAPTMFDRLYLRKPPGMMWAEAASAAVFGRSEWSARFVGAASSIALAMVCFGFGWRWFGARAGLCAGLALALTPWLWQSGRSAEIEPLHNLMVAVAAFCAIELLVAARAGADETSRGGGRRATALACGGVILAIAGAAAAKGPAGAPVLVGAIAGCLLVSSGARRGLAQRGALCALSLVAGGAIIAPVWLAFQNAGQTPGADPVSQGAAEFLWGGPALEILTLPFAALLAALPLTLALPQAWAGHSSSIPPGRGGYPVARALGWAFALSIAIYTLVGVSNVRYVMPAAALLAPLVGWAVVNGAGAPGRSLAGVFDRAIGRPALLWAGALLIGAQVWIWAIEPSRHGRSGRDAGRALAAALPVGAEVWANDLIEAVPETLLYAELASEAGRAGAPIRVVWRDVGPSGEAPVGIYLALRSDDASDEAAAWMRAGGLPGPVVFEGAVRHYRFVVVRMD